MNLSSCFTPQGRQLSAKLHVGSALTITRVVAGAGKTPPDGAALSAPMQALSLLPFRRDGNTVSLPATLLALQAQGDYHLTELGVYAQDPDLGEILYKICSLDAPLAISPHSPLILRFYLKEILTQSQLMPTVLYPDGVLLQPDLAPVQNKVNAVSVPTKQYTMDITEVQAFLDALPRLLTENLVITVSGTLHSTLLLDCFYGSGTISLTAATRGGCVLEKGVSCIRCSLTYIEFSNIRIHPSTNQDKSSAWIYRCSHVSLHHCDLVGNLQNIALYAEINSSVASIECTFAQNETAILSVYNSAVCVTGAAVADFHDNTVGAYVWRGGTILLCEETPDLLGGGWNVHRGGIIVSSKGTVI